MSEKAKKLYQKAKQNPQGIKFKEIKKLAELYGFEHDRTSGGHFQYKRHDDPYGFMNFQPRVGDKKMAKLFQVRQLVNFIDDNGLAE